MAWDLITKNFSISPEKLIITVFNEDEEAYKIWKKVSSFDDSKILKISTSDNFWEMGILVLVDHALKSFMTMEKNILEDYQVQKMKEIGL